MRKVEIVREQPDYGTVDLKVSGIGHMSLYCVKSPRYSYEQEKPWSITGEGVRFATKEDCIAYLENPPKPAK